jgi:iron complex outermembrane recepter protein
MKHRSLRWRFIATAAAASCLGTAAAMPALAQEGAIEEIVVTGSYIRRTTADSPSPLTVIGRAQIEQTGAIEIADIVNRMTFNSGSTNQTNAFSGGDNSTGQTNINLRNLGLGSTLVLVNGKRFVSTNTDSGGNAYVNTSTLVPSIALERVEVVKDGASALYGSDAVAGVVNFITRDNFDGMELMFDARSDQESWEQDDYTFAGIWGISSDRGHITVAAEYLERKGLQIEDRFSDFGGTGVSTLGNPGTFVPAAVPGSIASNPVAPGSSTALGTAAYVVGGGGALGDLDCELAGSLHRQSFRSPLSGSPLAGSALEGAGGCIYDFSPFFNLVGAETRFLTMVKGEYDLSESMQVYGEVSFSDQKFQRGNSLFPLVRFPFVPADNPGVQNDLARRDANLAAAGSPWRVAGLLTAPGQIEGTTFFGRVLGFTPDDTGTDLRPTDTDTREFSSVYRAILGVTGDLTSDGNWIYDLSLTRSERDNQARGTDTNQQNLQNAIRGFGGPNCIASTGVAGEGDCEYYNPFFSAFFNPDGTRQTDPALTNSPELINWMVGEFRSNTETKQTVVDLVLTGDIMEMPNGLPVGMAVGAQWRQDEVFFDADDTSNANGFSFIFGAQDFRGKENTYAAFIELAVPVTERLDLQIAGRYEDFDKLGDSTFDPKITAMFRATEDLTLRASAGTSFRIGSLVQRFGSSTQLINIADPYSGASLAFRPEIAQGNPDLSPEEATVWNVGLSWAPSEGPLQGLSVDIDYYDYDYEDLITRPGGAELIAQDIALRCPQGLNTNPADGPLCGVQPGGAIAGFDPNGGLNDQVIRDENGNFLRTTPSFTNAQELQTSGMDFRIGYQWATDTLGLFETAVQASWTNEYKITDANGVTTDGVGKRNANTVIGRSLPEWKANWSLAWQRDRHSAYTLVRYIDAYQDDQSVQLADFNGDGTADEPACVGSCLRATSFGISNLLDDRVNSFTTVDVQYSYELPTWGIQQEGSRISIGGQNVFNRTPPKLNFDGGFDPFTHDARGAIWYARYTMQL